MAAHALFGTPVWATLSAEGLARWSWPLEARQVTIYADAGEAGRQAAARLADRLTAVQIPNEIVWPLHGDDFNDDLLRGAVAADYGHAPIVADTEETAAPEITAPTSSATLAAELDAAAEALTNPPDVTALGLLLGRLVLARLDPLPERQVLARIKSRAGIAMSVLDKQLAELRRRLGAIQAARKGWARGNAGVAVSQGVKIVLAPVSRGPNRP